MLKKIKMLFLDTSLFRLSYMMFLFFWMVMYVEKAAYFVIYGLFVWGLALSVYSVFVKHTYKKMFFGLWLVAFLLSFSVTILVNINKDFNTVAYNIFMLLNCCVCFFMFYGIHTEKNVPFRWEFYLMARMFVYLATLFTLIGFLLLFFTSGKFDSYMYYQGGVFKGFYTNPNYQGYVSAISIIFCHMLTKQNFIAESGQKRVSRIWLASCVILNSIALLLCDSTASLLLIVAYVVIIIVMKLFSMIDDLNFRKVFTRVAMLLVAGAVMVTLMLFLRTAFRIGVVSLFSENSGLSQEATDKLTSSTVFNPKTDTGVTSRLFLWKAGLQIFLQNPIFGIGKGNLHNSIVEVTGRVNFHKDLEGLIQISAADLHNGLYTILVTAGLVGFILFVIFIIRYLSMVCPVWLVQRRIMTHSVYPCLLAFIFAYFVYSMVEKTILFDATFLVMSFWLIMGYTACYAIGFGYTRRGRFKLLGRNLQKKLI
ncbi:MAG: O-antigen ligase family protein [Eubacteriales bacterium]|nr:O-antigen ligase family protein [Eubacteriales bacterium]